MKVLALFILTEMCAVFASAPNSSTFTVRFDMQHPILDLTGAYWEHTIAADRQVDETTIAKVTNWKPIRVGRRWDRTGHPELNGKTVWLRVRFSVPTELTGHQIGFFCTAVDDEAVFFVNGAKVGGARYVWGGIVPGPTVVDLTPHVDFVQENVMLVKVVDGSPTRGGGILGNICFYYTLPYKRTEHGGIALATTTDRPLSVLLHLGEALLASGDQTTFSTEELRALRIPPTILREDELVLVLPSRLFVGYQPRHVLQLENVNPTWDQRELAISCSGVPDVVAQYDLMELPLSVAGTYANPFDPQQIEVTAIVRTPAGRVERVPAFFWQDFALITVSDNEEILLPKKNDPWRLNYRPRDVGVYEIEFIAQSPGSIRRAGPVKFTVTPSNRRGFLRVSKTDPRFFEFDSGESFFGRGPSGWFRDDRYFFGGNPRWVSVRRLDDFYARKAAAHSNYEYCLHIFFGQLYTRGGFIDQHVAWKTEHRLRTLERLGLYWIVVYDDILRPYLHNFNSMPYSVAQGGPCRSINEVYSNPRALQMQKDQLRYFVSRWSDSPALWIWNCGDESQPGSRFSLQLVRWWLKELHAYIRNVDIYQHPHIIGENALNEGSDGVIIGDWYFHDPPRGGGKGIFQCDRHFDDAVRYTACLLQRYNEQTRPVIIPEGGQAEWNRNYYLSRLTWDFPEAIAFHQNLWISLFLKSAAGGTDWLANIIDHQGELYHAAALYKYLEGESLTKTRWEIRTPTVGDLNLGAFALQADGKTLVWAHNKRYTWYSDGQLKQTVTPVASTRIAIPVSQNGSYRIELWDTRRGTVQSQSSVAAVSKTVTYNLPTVERDVALKVIHIGAALHK